jgi:hypothetical protein
MLLNFFSFCDVAEFWQIGLQDPATPSVEGMLFFHNTLVIVSIFIGSTVLFMLCAVIFFFLFLLKLVFSLCYFGTIKINYLYL